MFKIFRYLLKEEDVTENDFIIAVHLALEGNERAKGFLWVNEGIEKFSDSDTLYALRGNLYLLNNDMDRATEDLNKAFSLDPRNPVTLLGLAKLHFAKNNYTSAREYIQSTKETDPDGVFGEQADELLQKMENTGSGSINASGSIH